MAPSNLQHRRTHNLLLISKLLNQRDAASPFTLILDSLEQSGVPLVAEYVRRAKTAKLQTIFISCQALKNIYKADVFIAAWKQNLQEWQKEVNSYIKHEPNQRKLLIIDTLNTLSATHPQDLPGILSSLISPTTSLLAIYHTDIPSTPSHGTTQANPYGPAPLVLLKYLATTLLTTHSLHHILAREAALARSQVPPSFGLEEGVEGVVQGLGSNGSDGLVLELQHRRKSGRGVREWFVLPLSPPTHTTSGSATTPGKAKETVMLLEDHPSYAKLTSASASTETTGGEAGEGSTFELGLTPKQRADREGVVLPYFDAQKSDGGAGEGGRILYDMGSEDDFDEEEDEI